LFDKYSFLKLVFASNYFNKSAKSANALSQILVQLSGAGHPKLLVHAIL